MKNILIISHDATRTGAPILLLNLAKALKESYNIEFLLKNGGELEQQFASCAPTIFPYRSPQGIIRKVSYKLSDDKVKHNLSSLNWSKYDLVLSNTITNGDVLTLVKTFYKGKIVSYIHELEMATKFFTNAENVKNLLACSDAFLVPSLAVKEHLINNLSIDSNKVDLLSYYIEPTSATSKSASEKSNTTFVVGGVGTADWRKSPDLFIIIAKSVTNQRPDINIRFDWKGTSSSDSVEKDRLLYDIKKAGLEKLVLLIGSSSNVTDFYASINVLLLTSREDPYPLVVLEAADQSVPTICFSGAGGSPEFIASADGGKVIGYLNIQAAANAIISYYDNQASLKADGKRAKAMLLKTHQNKAFISNQFTTFVNKILH